MTNTYMLAGNSDPEEILASVDKGIYAVNFGGGQVDITSGKFVFSCTEAYLIEFLIAKLGDISIRDHKALAHALFRQFDPSVSMEDLEDRVDRLRRPEGVE